MSRALTLPDPHTEQKRLATTPSGRQAWITITAEDRRRALEELAKLGPKMPRYAEFIRRRENGEPWEHLERDARCEPDPATGRDRLEVFADAINEGWAIYETILNDMAALRAKLLP